ncbi:hypothetical protein BDV19DRAFT_353497 [Aspergillus venezuelensis]
MFASMKPAFEPSAAINPRTLDRTLHCHTIHPCSCAALPSPYGDQVPAGSDLGRDQYHVSHSMIPTNLADTETARHLRQSAALHHIEPRIGAGHHTETDPNHKTAAANPHVMRPRHVTQPQLLFPPVRPTLLIVPTPRTGAPKRFICWWPGCTQEGGFKRKGCLTRHVKTKHLSPGSHICYFCFRVFDRADNMQSHVKNRHLDR